LANAGQFVAAAARQNDRSSFVTALAATGDAVHETLPVASTLVVTSAARHISEARVITFELAAQGEHRGLAGVVVHEQLRSGPTALCR
jgi:hypothetical protein